MTVALYLLQRLEQLGLRHLFAVPGDYAGRFLDTLDAYPAIERVPTINELGCGYAADGYARYRGIGAACVQYGVGTFSILNCTAGSYVERCPVVVISASPATADRVLSRERGVLFHHSTGHLRADQQVFEHVTVASEIIYSGAEAPAQIDHALTALLTHQRPVYLEVLQDIWLAECAAPEGTLRAQPPLSDPDALRAMLDEAWQRIQTAGRPVLWAGVEIQRFGLQDELQQLVDASGLPFTTTSLGKTVLDESQPQFIGTYAGPASPDETRAIMAATDCIVALGTIITDDYLNIMKSAQFQQLVEVNAEQARIGSRLYPQVALPDFLRGLLERFQAEKQPPRPTAAEPPVAAATTPDHNTAEKLIPPDQSAEIATTLDPSVAAEVQLTYNVFYEQLTGFMRGQNLFNEVALVLGESTSLYVFGNLFGLPRNAFVAQAAWGSLGHETGCALGVALGSGRRPFVVAGDGGFMMICQELSSLARQQCPAVVFVLSNQGYAIEQAFVDIKAFTPEGSFAAFDVLPRWDYLALAQAFGAQGYRATTVAELSAVLNKVQADQAGPALVEVVIPPKDLAPQLQRLAETPAPVAARYHTCR